MTGPKVLLRTKQDNSRKKGKHFQGGGDNEGAYSMGFLSDLGCALAKTPSLELIKCSFASSVVVQKGSRL